MLSQTAPPLTRASHRAPAAARCERRQKDRSRERRAAALRKIAFADGSTLQFEREDYTVELQQEARARLRVWRRLLAAWAGVSSRVLRFGTVHTAQVARLNPLDRALHAEALEAFQARFEELEKAGGLDPMPEEAEEERGR